MPTTAPCPPPSTCRPTEWRPVSAIVDVPASATDGDTFFLQLSDGGRQIQAPNEWVLLVQLPPQLPAQVSVACTLVPPPGPELAVGQCLFQSTQTPIRPSNPVMNFDDPQPPPGTAANLPIFDCWASSEADAVRAAQDTDICSSTAPIPTEETTEPDVSGTYWFAIPLDGLPSGLW
ncbi:MAG: hypothetical protein ACRDJU_06675 [Actinomycetota bacterium]